MSIDYYLISKKAKRRVQVGSIGLGGVQSYPASPEVIQFIYDAIDSLGEWDDIMFMNENECEQIMDEGGWSQAEIDR